MPMETGVSARQTKLVCPHSIASGLELRIPPKAAAARRLSVAFLVPEAAAGGVLSILFRFTPPCIIKADFMQSFKLEQPCLVGCITFARRVADSGCAQ